MTNDKIKTARCTSGTATLNPFEQPTPKDWHTWNRTLPLKQQLGLLISTKSTYGSTANCPDEVTLLIEVLCRLNELEKTVAQLETAPVAENQLPYGNGHVLTIEDCKKLELHTTMNADGQPVIAPQEFTIVNVKTGALRKEYFGVGDWFWLRQDETIAYWVK